MQLQNCNQEEIFSPQGSKTTVTSTVTGARNFVGKAMDALLDFDKMLGDQFDQGLANLQSIVEVKQSEPVHEPVA